MKIGIRATVAVMLTVPAVFATGQMTGVSHPEEVPVSTSPEGIAQPVMYEAPAATSLPTTRNAPVLQARPASTPVLSASMSPVAATSAPREDSVLAVHGPQDPDASIVSRIDGPANQLPIGTIVKTKLGQELSTTRTIAGASWSAELTEAVERDGRVLIPAGSVLNGRVTDVHGGKRITGAASIHLLPQSVVLPDGTRYALHAQVIDTGLYKQTKVSEEGTIIRRDHAGKTLATMTLSTGSGAAAGAVFGGWPGALIGAGIGAGVSTVVWLKQDRQTALPAQTAVTFALTAPMTVGLQ